MAAKRKSDQAKKVLQQQGVVHLPAALDASKLQAIAAAADDCFTKIEQLIQEYGAGHVKARLPEAYEYIERSTSVSPVALNDYQTAPENILDLFIDSPGMSLLDEMLGSEIVCNLSKSRLTKQYALDNYHVLHAPNHWHQDGALGVAFPDVNSLTNSPFFSADMTSMVICWIPLVDCTGDRPCLQVVRKPLDRLLHYDYMNDQALEKIFAPQDFWVPEMRFGDMLIFLNGTLHRTYVTEAMKYDRTSIELRFMAPPQIPEWMQGHRFTQIR